MTNRMSLRFRAAVGLTLGLTGVVGCIPDPKGDFEDYQSRVRQVAQSVSTDASTSTASFDERARKGRRKFAGVCLTQLNQSLKKVLSFAAVSEFEPQESGGGKLVLRLTSLRLGGNSEPPTTYSLEGQTGATYFNRSPSEANVDADGRFTVNFGQVIIPGDANSISGREVRIQDTSFQGRFAEGKFCARLDGNLTQPVGADLSPRANICQFRFINDGEPMPVFTSDDFKLAACPE